MKKITLALGQIAKKKLTQRQQALIKGGRVSCWCACCYDGTHGPDFIGSTDTIENGCANNTTSGKNPCGGDYKIVVC